MQGFKSIDACCENFNALNYKDIVSHYGTKNTASTFVSDRIDAPVEKKNYHDDVLIAVNAGDCAVGGSGDSLLFLFLFFFLTLIFLLGGLIALIRTGVALSFFSVGHHVDEALQRWAEFSLLIFFEAIVEGFVDHDTQ